MPAAMTYDSLVTDLQAYLQRTDATIVNQIPRFIMLAQQAVSRDLKILGFREEATGSFDSNAQSTGMVQKPADWRKSIAMWVSTGSTFDVHTPVYERTYEYLREIFPDPTIQGIPRFYADADWNHWLVLPAPNPALAPYFKVAYYGTLILIDGTNQTNWLTKNAPDWLLYRCLKEAAGFVKTDERIPVWGQNYDQATQSLLKQEMHGLIDRAASTTENG
jgi:hypothetical protein